MSFSDRPSLSWPQKLGCIIYAAGSVFVVSPLGIMALFPDSDSPPPPMWERLLAFPGSLILVTLGGIFLISFFMRDKS